MKGKNLTRSEALEAWSAMFAAASVNSLAEAIAFADRGLARLEEIAGVYTNEAAAKTNDAQPELEDETKDEGGLSPLAGGKP